MNISLQQRTMWLVQGFSALALTWYPLPMKSYWNPCREHFQSPSSTLFNPCHANDFCDICVTLRLSLCIEPISGLIGHPIHEVFQSLKQAQRLFSETQSFVTFACVVIF